MSDMFESLSWNKKIEVLRTMKGWTQNEAAEECLTNQKAYWSWETGKTKPRKISRQAICNAFGVREDEIFGGE
ncbi:helix-turn-helix transcriptional regulator [Clostridium sp. YIM B02551]|uniref:helix-turn-helix transcriptional regulator n=1 Tax=Clostridium sp. YIM B02551 TaxID=2910679 RepID=UPI001EEB0381|nr:helix-turn-helix transcriptional regulator [Clostridium sp. YIM B02551]